MTTHRGHLGLSEGFAVLEIGYDEDCDEDFRKTVEVTIETELLDEDAEDVVDAVLLWWREEDGDLTDALVDALTPLTNSGLIWLLTPKPGRDGAVEPADIAEAAKTSGLQPTRIISAGPDWQGSRLVAPKSARR